MQSLTVDSAAKNLLFVSTKNAVVDIQSSPRLSARGIGSSVLAVNKFRKKAKQKRAKSPDYIVLNTSPTKTNDQRKEIERAHQKLFDKNKKVRFQELKYDLDDLFEMVKQRNLDFEEPVLKYNDGFIPQKLQFPNQKRPDGSAPAQSKISKMEAARANNLAVINLESQTKQPKKESKKEESPNKKFDVLKQPNLLFYCVSKDQVETLKNLSEEYIRVNSPQKPSNKKVLEPFQLQQVSSDTSFNWNQSKERNCEEPKSGFINFSKIFDKIQEKKRKTEKIVFTKPLLGSKLQECAAYQPPEDKYVLDSKIRITANDFPETKTIDKKKKGPIIPAHFKSIIKKEPARLVDNIRLVTMKKILVDRLQVDLAAHYQHNNKTPEQVKFERTLQQKAIDNKLKKFREHREQEKRKFGSRRRTEVDREYSRLQRLDQMVFSAQLSRSSKKVHDAEHRLSENYAKLVYKAQKSPKSGNLYSVAQKLDSQLRMATPDLIPSTNITPFSTNYTMKESSAIQIQENNSRNLLTGIQSDKSEVIAESDYKPVFSHQKRKSTPSESFRSTAMQSRNSQMKTLNSAVRPQEKYKNIYGIVSAKRPGTESRHNVKKVSDIIQEGMNLQNYIINFDNQEKIIGKNVKKTNNFVL